MAKIFFFIPQTTSLFDLTGIYQVFQEAIEMGLNYEVIFVSESSHQLTPSGLKLGNLKIYKDYNPAPSDIVMIPGKSERNPDFREWVIKSYNNGVTVCGICTGVFTLAYTGLLDGREATTHWKHIDSLQANYPKVKVITNRIFVKADKLYSTAGVSAGIDLALHLIEKKHGSHIAAAISKELVLYRQRFGGERQLSIYTQRSMHTHEKIHQVQKLISLNIDIPLSITELADKVFMSSRNLSRTFKKVTGITIGSYRKRLRTERALTLLASTSLTVETIAQMSGYRSPKQLRIDLESGGYDLPSRIRDLWH